MSGAEAREAQGGEGGGHTGRVGGVVLCVPTRLDPVPFEPVRDRLLMIASEHGMTNTVTQRAAKRLPGAKRALIKDYEAHGWSDAVSDHAERVAGLMSAFLRKTMADHFAQFLEG